MGCGDFSSDWPNVRIAAVRAVMADLVISWSLFAAGYVQTDIDGGRAYEPDRYIQYNAPGFIPVPHRRCVVELPEGYTLPAGWALRSVDNDFLGTETRSPAISYTGKGVVRYGTVLAYPVGQPGWVNGLYQDGRLRTCWQSESQPLHAEQDQEEQARWEAAFSAECTKLRLERAYVESIQASVDRAAAEALALERAAKEAAELARHAPPAPAEWFCYGVTVDEILAENPRLVRGMGISLQKHGITGELMPGALPLVAVRSYRNGGKWARFTLEIPESVAVVKDDRRWAGKSDRNGTHLDIVGAVLAPDWSIREVTRRGGEVTETIAYPPVPAVEVVEAQTVSFGSLGDLFAKKGRK